MNHIQEIAKMLDVELDKHFMISGQEQTKFFFEVPYGLLYSTPTGPQYRNDLLPDLILGRKEIIKLPWKPKAGKIYFYLSGRMCNLYVRSSMWTNDLLDICFYKSGNCFRTEEEAEANKQLVWDYLTKGDKE